MQIPFSVSVGGTLIFSMVVVAGRCADAEVSNLSHGMQQLVQGESGIDGDEGHLYGRGGRTFKLSFSGHRFHDSNTAAAAFVVSHPGDMPVGHGAAAFTAGGATAGYARGIVTRCEVSQNDTETITQYELELTKTNN